MPLIEKVTRSGLDLSGRTRPTLVLLPRGNWIRHYYYDFPALLSGGIDQLIDYGLHCLAEVMPNRQEVPALNRFILSAHSGGGMPAIDVIAEAPRLPDEAYIFDGLYGRDPAGGNPTQGLEVIDRWLAQRFAQEPQRPGALRVIFIEHQTGPFSRLVGELIARHLATSDPDLTAGLSRRYRVEPSGVQHSQVARRCLPELLTASDTQFDWRR